jgi:hypothetical protein
MSADTPTFEEARTVLYAPEAVSAAANLVASCLGGGDALLLEQLGRWLDELEPLPVDDRTTAIVGILASLSELAAVACHAHATIQGEDPLDTLRYCESVLEDLREGRDRIDSDETAR